MVATCAHGALAETELVTRGIVAAPPKGVRSVKADGGYMVPYVEKIPGTDVSFEMIPVPGGEFLMGSPANEAHRHKDEGPQVRVKVEPFWIGKTEVTWGEYHSYMSMYDAFKKLQRLAANPGKDGDAEVQKDRKLVETHAWNGKFENKWEVDGVTCPTPLYDSTFTYSAGDQPAQPAVTVTPFSARQYTKWISGITGNNYRLPAGAEWEYAARSGKSTAYSFGESVSDLNNYAWYTSNSLGQSQPVASKRPNGFSLYDMHGNVWEWVHDIYKDYQAGEQTDPVAHLASTNSATALHVMRGGCWGGIPRVLRSGNRSHIAPHMRWSFLGFRLQRSAR